MSNLHGPGVRKFEPWPCPKCGYVMDAASHVAEDGALLEDGDWTVCLQCAEPFLLDHGRWRLPTDDELIDLSFDDKQEISRFQILVRQFNSARRDP